MYQRKERKTAGLGRAAAALAIVILAFVLAGCGSGGGSAESGPPEIAGLTFEESVELKKADQFSIYRYEDGYSVIDIVDEGRFLVVPEGGKIPEGLAEDITVLQKPLDRIYVAATASMALFCSMDALENVGMSSLDADGWSYEEPRRAIEKGEILYAGKYSRPDYELLLDEECDLAVESTMITHTPEVQEMIEELEIPVLVDRSSYESDPLGRSEWIRLYGVLTDHEKEADAFFEKQLAQVSELDDFKNTEKTVAFFYISSDGKAIVRRSTDYVPKMIETAGGRYVFKELDDEDGRSSTDMSIEQFYDAAKDADIIIYNGSIDRSVKDLAGLKEKDPVMKEMKAVKEGNCWVTGESMYQRTDIVADMIMDFHRVISDGDPAGLRFITKLK